MQDNCREASECGEVAGRLRWVAEGGAMPYQNQEEEVLVGDEEPYRGEELAVDEQHGDEQQRAVRVGEADLCVRTASV